MHALKWPINSARIVAIMRGIDTDGGGEVSQEEFTEWWEAQLAEETKDETKEGLSANSWKTRCVRI